MVAHRAIRVPGFACNSPQFVGLLGACCALQISSFHPYFLCGENFFGGMELLAVSSINDVRVARC